MNKKKEKRIISNFAINTELEKIIGNSQELLIICSPFFRLGQRTKMILSKTKKVKSKYLIVREHGNNIYDHTWLKGIGFQIFEIPYLHSKLYISEKKILLTSMNLYDYSQANSIEIGIIINKEDKQEYQDCIGHIVELVGSIGVEDKNISSNYETEDFCMRNLERTIRKEIGIKKSINYEHDRAYQYICSIIMNNFKFEKKDLYQDGTAILRSTDLGQEKFLKSLELVDRNKYKKLV